MALMQTMIKAIITIILSVPNAKILNCSILKFFSYEIVELSSISSTAINGSNPFIITLNIT